MGIDEFLTRDTGTGPRGYLADALGSPLALTAPSGAVETSATYEPFGAQTTTGAPSSNRVGFTGREADGTGLMYYRARYYSPTLQRFVSEDPAGFVDGPNLYSYVNNAPSVFTDPLGLEKRTCVPVFIAMPLGERRKTHGKEYSDEATEEAKRIYKEIIKRGGPDAPTNARNAARNYLAQAARQARAAGRGPLAKALGGARKNLFPSMFWFLVTYGLFPDDVIAAESDNAIFFDECEQ